MNSVPRDGNEQGPQLKQIHGLDKACAWGEMLAQDLAAYKEGRLAWRDIDRGLLLYGPPGTGKTTFARALAATCKVPLIATSYAQWQREEEGHLGDVLKAMKEDFDQAAKSAPAILFIDEVDALPARSASSPQNRDWWMSVTKALLECLDGIAGREGVVVIGACNEVKHLDPALTRAGRFDQKMEVHPPGPNELEGIFRYHLGDELKEESLHALAIGAIGCTGADVEYLVRAARRVARQHDRALTVSDLFDSLNHEGHHLPAEMIRRTAIHEAGHAVAALSLDMAESVAISLAPRGGQNALTRIEMRRQSVTRAVIERQIAVALAGRAAEEVVLSSVAAGAGGDEDSDLARATKLATDMVTVLGFSDHAPLLWVGREVARSMLGDADALGREVREILDRAYAQACTLITAHHTQILAIADALVAQRGLSDEEIRKFMGEPVSAPEALSAETAKFYAGLAGYAPSGSDELIFGRC